MQFGHLTYLELKEKASTGAVAIVPTGCTEQQGPHLPVDFDTWLSETLCFEAANQASLSCKHDFLVLPVLPFGPTPEHRGFGAGYIHLDQSIHEAILSSIMESLAEQGFRKIIVWRGCGQHNLENVIRHFNQRHAGNAEVFLPGWIFFDIWNKVGDPAGAGGHADSFATSIALFLRPDSVRIDRIFDPQNKIIDWQNLDIDISQYTSSGVIGDPTQASASIGAILWRETISEMAKIFCDIALSSNLPLNLT